MNRKPPSKLRAKKEVLVTLTEDLLGKVAGGEAEQAAARRHCPAANDKSPGSTTSASVIVG